RVTGGVQGMHLEPADSQGLAGIDDARALPPLAFRLAIPSRAWQELALERADQHREPWPALAQTPDLADVVEVVVGEQHVCWRQPPALGGLDQRLHRAAGVDEERAVTRLVTDEVGVRQELRMGRAFDDHGEPWLHVRRSSFPSADGSPLSSRVR